MDDSKGRDVLGLVSVIIFLAKNPHKHISLVRWAQTAPAENWQQSQLGTILLFYQSLRAHMTRVRRDLGDLACPQELVGYLGSQIECFVGLQDRRWDVLSKLRLQE